MPVPRESSRAALALIETADDALTRLNRLWVGSVDYPIRLWEAQECLAKLRVRLVDAERGG